MVVQSLGPPGPPPGISGLLSPRPLPPIQMTRCSVSGGPQLFSPLTIVTYHCSSQSVRVKSCARGGGRRDLSLPLCLSFSLSLSLSLFFFLSLSHFLSFFLSLSHARYLALTFAPGLGLVLFPLPSLLLSLSHFLSFSLCVFLSFFIYCLSYLVTFFPSSFHLVFLSFIPSVSPFFLVFLSPLPSLLLSFFLLFVLFIPVRSIPSAPT